MLFQLADYLRKREIVPNTRKLLEQAIDELTAGDQRSKQILNRAAKHYNDTRAAMGFVQTLESLNLRGPAIGKFHFTACGGSDHLFRIVVANEATGVTSFGVSQHNTPAKLQALAEVLKQDETTQKMMRHIG